MSSPIPPGMMLVTDPNAAPAAPPKADPPAPKALNPAGLLGDLLGVLKVGPVRGFSEILALVSAVFPAYALVDTGRVNSGVTGAWAALVAVVVAGRKLQGVRNIAAAESVAVEMVRAGQTVVSDLGQVQNSLPAGIAAELRKLEGSIHNRLSAGEDWVVAEVAKATGASVAEVHKAVSAVAKDVKAVADHLPQVQPSRASVAKKAAPPAA